jgi:ABC-type multidrug transport system ATPase subunit
VNAMSIRRERKEHMPMRKLEAMFDRGTLVIEARNLSVRWTGTTERNRGGLNASFDINRGEIIHIVGESGSGKTTLLKLLCGHKQAISGTLLISGKSWDMNDHELRNSIGYVPQESEKSLYGDLTVYETLDYYAMLLMDISQLEVDGNELDSRYDHKPFISQILYDLDLESSKDTQVKNLSGGQRKRVSIAVELLSVPNALVLDEPDSGLNYDNRVLLRNILKKLAKNEWRMTIILTTHYEGELNRNDDVVSIETDKDKSNINIAKRCKWNDSRIYRSCE